MPPFHEPGPGDRRPANFFQKRPQAPIRECVRRDTRAPGLSRPSPADWKGCTGSGFRRRFGSWALLDAGRGTFHTAKFAGGEEESEEGLGLVRKEGIRT